MIQYDHGERVTAHYHEQTPLDRAIVEFEQKATAHYTCKTSTPANETPEQRAKREKELATALTHLKQERCRALTKIQVQTRLDEYQAASRLASTESTANRQERGVARGALASEKHHPTDKLANFMRMSGRPQPSPRFTAHHMIMGAGRTEDAARARVQLHFHGIGINDPDNGVWMPMTRADRGHWAYRNAAAHSQIHTKNYQRWVWANVQFMESEQEFRGKLMLIRTDLKNGIQPQKVTERPDPNWNGYA